MTITEFKNFKTKIVGKKSTNLGRIISLDVGTKRIGVAICDDSQTISTPKTIINRQSNQKDFAVILQILQDTNAIAIVIGLPINLDESTSAMSEFVKRFAQNLEQFLHDNFENSTIKNEIDILLFDERYSSFTARSINNHNLKNFKQKKFLDDVASSLILEHFLQNLHQSNN
jgi:putative Holliday junction resolvase